MYGIVPAPGGMLQELHVMDEHSRAVFRGIVGHGREHHQRKLLRGGGRCV